MLTVKMPGRVGWGWALGLLGCDTSGGTPPCPDGGCPVPLPTVAYAAVTGACPVEGGTRLDVVVAEGERGITLADFQAAALPPPTADDFVFETAQLAPFGGQATGVALPTRAVAFTGPTGPRLVVLVLDQSASLVGLDHASGTTDATRASDPSGVRFSFFASLIAGLPADVSLALVSFKGLFGQVDPTFGTPTQDRQVLRDGLTRLDGDESGDTPLARGLIDALEKVVQTRPELAASVVVFTDGVEAGDTSNLPDRADPSDLGAALAAYRAAGVPVHIIQLAPPAAAETPRDRDTDLADFACKTGGSWFYAPTPAALDEALRATLTRRLAGAWQVEAAAVLAGSAELDVVVEALGQVGGGRPWVFW